MIKYRLIIMKLLKKLTVIIISFILLIVQMTIRVFAFSFDFTNESEQADWAGYDSYINEHSGEPDLADGDLEQKLYPFYYDAFPEEREPDADDLAKGIIGWDYDGDPIYRDNNSQSSNKNGTDYNRQIIDYYTNADDILHNNSAFSNPIVVSGVQFQAYKIPMKDAMGSYYIYTYIPNYWKNIPQNDNKGNVTIASNDGKFFVSYLPARLQSTCMDESVMKLINDAIQKMKLDIQGLQLGTSVNINDTLSFYSISNNRKLNFKFIVYQNVLLYIVTFSNHISNFDDKCAEFIINNKKKKKN